MAPPGPQQGRPFYCREWVFQKLQRCLQEKSNPLAGGSTAPTLQPGGRGAASPSGRGASWGVLLVGGPGCGKTALCRELLWPSRTQGLLRGLHLRSLAFHFCHALDADTLSVGRFVRGLVAQLCRSVLVPGFEEALRDPAAQSLLQPGECERDPAEAFKRCVLLPLLSLKPPQQSLFLLVDSVDEGCQLGEAEPRMGAWSAAESRKGAGSEAEPSKGAGSGEEIRTEAGSEAEPRTGAGSGQELRTEAGSEAEPRTGSEAEPSTGAESETKPRVGAKSEAEPSVGARPCRTIAELLASHHQLLPPWLLLICSSRRQNRAVTKLFTGFRKISLDDLRKAHVVKDVQQYILHRLDQEEALRRHLTKETAEMLNQLHIKSGGCFLYLERVLDGAGDGFLPLREIRHIPGTLNGLYLWLCQRLFARKRFAAVRPVLDAALAARRPLAVKELYHAAWTRDTALTMEEFRRKMDALAELLVEGAAGTRTLFHASFAEWLLDVKHCTPRYLCSAAEGHRMLAMSYSCRARELGPAEVREFALHLVRADLRMEPAQLALWMVWNGTPAQDSLGASPPEEREVLELLVKAGAHVSGGGERGGAGGEPGRRGEESVRALLENGASVNWTDGGGRSLLASAAYGGSLGAVDLLAGRGADLELADGHGQTPLTLAARQGHAAVVERLIGYGAAVDRSDHDGWTALRSAAWAGHAGAVAALLRAGARVDCADADGRTPLRAAAWAGHADIALSLLRHGAQADRADREGRTPLIAAAYAGHRRVAEHLLRHGARLDHQDADGRTALAVAALRAPSGGGGGGGSGGGHASVVGLLVECGAEVDRPDKEGVTPLLAAAYEGHAEAVDLLLEGGADVDHADRSGRTPLLAAASMGHAAVVKALLFWGSAVDGVDAEGRTVLGVAAAQGSVEVVRLLLDRGLDESHRDDAGRAPLHAAAFEGHRAVCQALVDHGARCGEVDNDGRIPLVLAAQEGHRDCVRVLLEACQAGPDQRGYDGRNALRVAAQEGHRDVVELLLAGGADVDCRDADGRTTLYALALENQLGMAECLLEHGAGAEARDPEGRTALHVACWQGHLEMARALVTHGADVNAADGERRSPLQSAAWRGHAAVARLLLDAGARPDHACDQGATALGVAAQEGHAEVVRALLDRGADPNHADRFGRTAVRVATRGGHAHIVQLLEKYGAVRQAGSPPTTKSAAPPRTKSTGTSTGRDDPPPAGPAQTFVCLSECPVSPATRSLPNHSPKSSQNSLRTASSAGTGRTTPADGVPPPSHTLQVQQRSLPRRRDRGSGAAPASASRSPSSDREGNRVKLAPKGRRSGSGGGGGSGRSGSGRRKFQNGPAPEYDMSRLAVRPTDPLRNSQQGGAENKRNAVATGPKYHLQGQQGFLCRGEGYPIREPELYPIREAELSLKRALMLSEAADPSLSCKKETPL
ncbi:ankyrin repeat domain-containing protein 50-like [Anguilla anguilla]|uniref:ankyrin repeat domain-containing protein 50-like n=1 Tax=Anguilla anguilla TaxID=7936 RepID=UPI0015B3308B|nr:ankyrin repeat domain-containing protein 50-like [Anguilla anguilla]XP_035272843.1 ankyrin repeat domain-containing protein 50-like [Anguilla anguilla]